MTESHRGKDVAARDGWLALPDRYRAALCQEPDHHSQLIPHVDLGPLVQVLEHRLRPATPKELAGALSIITAAWQGYDRLEPKIATAHLRLLREDLSGFPATVLSEAIAELRKTQRFTPSIAEFYQLASLLVQPDRLRLRIAQRHLVEHERRAAHERAEAERAAGHRREAEARLARYARQYGSAWPGYTLDDYSSAWSAMFAVSFHLAGQWYAALETGEPWAAAIMPSAIVAGCVFALTKAKRITEAEASQLVSLIGRDLERARALVATIEAGTAGDWADTDPATSWGDPSRAFADLVDQARRLAAVA